MPVTADPAHLASGYPEQQRVVRVLTTDHGARTEQAVASEISAADHSRVGTERGTAANARRSELVATRQLRAWILHVREHAGWPTEDFILELDPVVHRNV